MAKATQKDQDKDERKVALRKAYGQATQDLREAHQDEFNDLYAKRAQEAGYDWQPRLTPEQKAEQEFDLLLQQYPHLADRLAEEDEEEPQSEAS